MKEERSLKLGSPLTGGETRLEGFGAEEDESVASGLQKALQRVTCPGGGHHCPELPVWLAGALLGLHHSSGSSSAKFCFFLLPFTDIDP